jgi:hypothetical protein
MEVRSGTMPREPVLTQTKIIYDRGSAQPFVVATGGSPCNGVNQAIHHESFAAGRHRQHTR